MTCKAIADLKADFALGWAPRPPAEPPVEPAAAPLVSLSRGSVHEGVTPRRGVYKGFLSHKFSPLCLSPILPIVYLSTIAIYR